MESINEIVTMGIVVIFAYYTIMGYRKGFIKQAASVVNTILALIVAPVVMPIFLEVLKQLDFTNMLQKYIQAFLDAYYYSHTASGIRLEESITNATLVGVDAMAIKILAQNAEAIAGNITRVMAYSLGYIFVRLILSIVFNVAAIISSLPIVHEFDKAIGALSGGLMTLLMVWVIITLISMITFVPVIGGICEKILTLPVINAIRTVNPFQLLLETIEMIK